MTFDYIPDFESKPEDSNLQGSTDASNALLADATNINPFESASDLSSGVQVAWNSNEPMPEMKPRNRDRDKDKDKDKDRDRDRNRDRDRSRDHNRNRTDRSNRSSSESDANASNRNNIDVNNRNNVRNDVDVNNRQGQEQSQSSENTNSNVNTTGDSTATATGGDQNVNSAGGNVEITEGNIDARSLGLSRAPIMTNQCSEVSFQIGGGAGFVHGDISYMKANEECLEAAKVQADCDGAESISRATLNTAKAQMLWGDKEHGIQTTRVMAEITAEKSKECANLEGEIEISAPSVVIQKSEVTEERLIELEEKVNIKIERAFEHSQMK